MYFIPSIHAALCLSLIISDCDNENNHTTSMNVFMYVHECIFVRLSGLVCGAVKPQGHHYELITDKHIKLLLDN